MSGKPLQVSQTSQDACRLDGGYLLSSPPFNQATNLLAFDLGSPNLSNVLNGYIWRFQI